MDESLPEYDSGENRILFMDREALDTLIWAAAHNLHGDQTPKIVHELLPRALSHDEVASFATQVDTRVGTNTGAALGPYLVQTKAVYWLGKMSAVGGDRETFNNVLDYLSRPRAVGTFLTRMLRRYDKNINSA